MKVLIIFAIIFNISIAFRVFDLEVSSQCNSAFTGVNGTCLEAKDCPEFITNREDLRICSFKQRVPIVCCPQNVGFRNEKARISAQSKKLNFLN